MERSVKAEFDKDVDHSDLHMTDTRPSYKSWKKKYRKMRIKFDHQMQEIETLHKLEQKAMRTAKRLAIENDRLLDLLFDINESPQIPFERRIDLSLEDDDDDNDSDATQKPTRSLRRLEEDVPHRSFAATVEQYPEILDDLEPRDPQIHPTSFLTADDVDEYLHELDTRLGLKPKPTLAPSAIGKEIPNPAANFALRNPTSVYNWLRRHAPKTFLQDLEKEKDKDKGKDKDDGHDKEDDGRKRKGGGTARNKRQSAVSRKEKEKEAAESMDWDDDAGYDAPAKGKRKRDDDGGYRPKGGSSRPTKKRKSKDFGSLPTKGSRKSTA
ncbi:IEC3 subunit of the Ino80 complex, chromatin re-modelling-domain-containing protein [Daldinia loculata]|uniref:IEC3 subunit of the Ino80 complex, chromatin re-modelling-domain-containing protein n=1 Tax=Daldinia loculata TaxID=103429 RepID=UPI0020C588E4|nr:IEC3 subunit of the Ino80 complex, chromatin re-modelling-domain-containing protein [Daldinia loculata]KAI1650143.1 IEC3 subunit of the Ino80 complex, chromatin re-modelling-domain-containing protein [Daldinia loculata]